MRTILEDNGLVDGKTTSPDKAMLAPDKDAELDKTEGDNISPSKLTTERFVEE
jgi:hypothetical protein